MGEATVSGRDRGEASALPLTVMCEVPVLLTVVAPGILGIPVWPPRSSALAAKGGSYRLGSLANQPREEQGNRLHLLTSAGELGGEASTWQGGGLPWQAWLLLA
uniref:Uncharacterized protein n=1 Tax=Chromera velia CCMP2878 TaxID=1169474 RepID=A0A0G4FRK3_9ALVE|eukprot:Cvel_18410.t1-p1 / transcript=Cvel_18410.t1 / gene=Cvel_18410 / organism=Chromera_velia_CCMP2878 / gene_product=hypothetical protein / transcript_product=hypothetical protein / location=Cvel_scaffold1522:37345-37653(+) / protein_length=103 / sequence_SO=supercontig / SO=protein_coding / is_pseudo=false